MMVRQSVIVALAMVALFACAHPRSPAQPVTSAQTATDSTIDGARAKRLVDDGAKLVDVRSLDEFAQNHIAGAENVPVDTVGDHDFGPKDKAIVVYCRSGGRAARAAEGLRAKGYTHVYNLGAMSSWPE